jgi:hypothetical protein
MREPLAMEQLDTPSTANDPLTEAIRRADLAALWRAIEALPRPQRDALLLREFGGLSYGELSAALAVSGAAVESLLFRARQRLRGQLRTAYATVSGASWIDALVRLFAGGSAPIAAKVAVLGAGAAVVGGTAVVVPNVLDNHRHAHSTQRSPASVTHRSEAGPAPLLVEHAVTTSAREAMTPPVVVPASNENDVEQDQGDSSQTASQRSNHATRAETSNIQGARGESGDGGDPSASDQRGDGRGDGPSPADGSSTATIPEHSTWVSAPSEDGGGN